MSGEKDLNLNGEEDEDEKERILQRKLDEEQLEIESLRRIISAYLNYPDAADEDVRRYERSYRKLSPAHKENKNSKQYILTKPEDSDSPLEDPVLALLSHYPLKFKTLRRCISANTFFIMNMLQAFEPPFDMSQDTDNCEHSHAETADDGNLVLDEGTASSCQHAGGNKSVCCTGPSQPCCGEESSAACNLPKGFTRDETPSLSCECVHPSIYNVPLVDVDKVRCIVRNIIRDWAVEGQKEREQCYKPILDELDSQFPDRSKMSPPACLVPGAGLGRLTLEISCKGFMSQGNEFSYYMMICSSFILNHTQKVGEWTIYPWIHSNCNSFSDSDQCRPVSIPDIHPASAGITEGFSMCGGDFVEVYSDPSQMGTWDAVVTCFFLDTAHNIIEYIEIISKILKDGGVWINFGPLLYHFAEMYGQDEMSIELSLEDVKKVALHYGFELEKEKMVETTYTTNPRSMMQNRYNAAFWTMRKKKQNKDGDGMDT